MRTLICSGLLCLVAVVPARANGWFPGPPIEVDAGFNAWLNIRQAGTGGLQLGPWYSYWPMEAHFQTPAPVGGHFPHWPPYLSERLNGGSPGGPPPGDTPPPPGNLNFQPPPPTLVPSAYRYPYGYGHTYPQSNYWYGR